MPPRRPLGVLLTRLGGPKLEPDLRGVLVILDGVCFAVERGVAVDMRLDIGAVSGDIGERSEPDTLLVDVRVARFGFVTLSFDGVGRGDTRGLAMRDGEEETRGPVPPSLRALPLFFALLPGVPRCGEHRASLVVETLFCTLTSPRRTAATPFFILSWSFMRCFSILNKISPAFLLPSSCSKRC